MTTPPAPSRPRTRPRKGAAVRRSLVMQGILFQAGLAAILSLMMVLSRNDTRFFLAYGWSLVVPLGVGLVFWNAFQRTERLGPDEAVEGERREGKRALGLLGAVVALWVAGLAVIFFLT